MCKIKVKPYQEFIASESGREELKLFTIPRRFNANGKTEWYFFMDDGWHPSSRGEDDILLRHYELDTETQVDKQQIMTKIKVKPYEEFIPESRVPELRGFENPRRFLTDGRLERYTGDYWKLEDSASIREFYELDRSHRNTQVDSITKEDFVYAMEVLWDEVCDQEATPSSPYDKDMLGFLAIGEYFERRAKDAWIDNARLS